MQPSSVFTVMPPVYARSSFGARLRSHGLSLRRSATTTLQINVGKRCNQACHHCHVEAGPKRPEMMTAAVAGRVLELLKGSPTIETVDLTGGAPELNPNFRLLAAESRRSGRHVIDRSNLTVLFEPGQEYLPEFLASNRIEVIASLPCYTRENVDRQRGRGVFEKSIEALRVLNRHGYGLDPNLPLRLMFNPGGASLPPPQEALENEYRTRLQEDFGIVFTDLLTLTNMPIRRFADYLANNGKTESYARLLSDNFNAANVEGLMCRSLISVSWDGRFYDCDFNQMLELHSPAGRTIWDIQSFSLPAGAPIATAEHCFGCTAGAGSSCGGKLSDAGIAG